ncbi:MAG: extracellular solute-binding protein [SAR324 cluster bacterium]|nr:extracellular solute-binding protein [SAR324 cluster bacterium]
MKRIAMPARVWAAAGAAWLGLLAGVALPWPAAADELVIYSGRGERFTRPIVEAFEAATGIATQTLVGDSNQLLTRIEEEGERTQADVFLTNYAGLLDIARRRGLLQPYRSPAGERVPPEFHGPDDTWIAASARARVIVYNTDRVDPARLSSMLDLADPEWEGQLGITVSSNASFIGGLAAMIKQEGTERVRGFLEGIKPNAGKSVYPTHTPLVSAVARGEGAIGLINQYYYYRALAKNPALPLAIVYPDQETHGATVTVSGLAILRHAHNVPSARRFVDFVLSDAGQKLFAEVNYEFPVSPTVPAHPLLPQPGTVKFSPVSQALQVEAIDEAVALIKSVGLQ